MKNLHLATHAASAFAFTAALAACSGGAPDGAEDAVPLASAESAADGKSYAALFRDTSTMRGDPGDWDPCHGKASCAPGERIRGMSETPGGSGRTALCTAGAGFDGAVTATLRLDDRADQRRAERRVNGDPDWAFGHYKLECGDGEYVSAVSEDAAQCSGDNRFHAVQCAKGSGLSNDGCSVRVFDRGDDRGANASGDWDYGAFKGECAGGEYVAGVSVDPSSGAPHGLLCCPAKGGGGGSAAPGLGDPFFGLSSDAGTWGSDQAKTLRGLGAGMVRIQLCDWPASKGDLVKAVDAANAAGLHVLAELNYCTVPGYSTSASWHAGFADSGNAFSQAFTATAADVAATFAGRGMYYEIWNEGNAAPRPLNWPQAQWPAPGNADWDGACGAYAYGADYGQAAWALCPRQLGVLTVNAFMAIKGADPGAEVVTGNMLLHGDKGWVAMEYWKQVEKSPAVSWYRQNKGGVPWDAIGIHPYAYSPLDGGLDARIGEFQAIVQSYGDPAPTAITEYGWSTGPEPDQYHKADEPTQAAYLKATYQIARQRGVAFVDWFNYLDGPGITYGLRRTDMSWKPSARAYCEAAGSKSCPAP